MFHGSITLAAVVAATAASPSIQKEHRWFFGARAEVFVPGVGLAGEFGAIPTRWLYVGAMGGAAAAMSGGDACWYEGDCAHSFTYLAGFAEARLAWDFVLVPRARVAAGAAFLALAPTIDERRDSAVAAYVAPEAGLDVVLNHVSFGPYGGFRVFSVYNDPHVFVGLRVNVAF